MRASGLGTIWPVLGVMWLFWHTAAAPPKQAPCSSWNTPDVQQPSKRCDNGRGAVFDHISKLQSKRLQEETFDVLFLGDSIFGTFAGSTFENMEAALDFECWYCDPAAPAAFERTIGRFHRTAIFAIGGDQTMHLLWRLKEGGLVASQPASVKVVVLHIGANDIGTLAGATDLHTAGQAISQRIQDIVNVLLAQYPSAKVLVVGILPRAARFWSPSSMSIATDGTPMGVPENFYKYPNPTFTAAIDSANGALRGAVPSLAPGRTHYIECSNIFLNTTDETIKSSLMPDGIHFNAAGGLAFASCIGSYLRRLVPHAAADEL